MRVCKLCKKTGHNKATCGKPPKAPKAPTGNRKCGRCGQIGSGHNKKTCTVDLGGSPENSPVFSQPNQGDVTTESIPEKSLWLVSYVRKMVAGKVIQTNQDGSVLWEDKLGTLISSNSDSLSRSDYTCCSLEPHMLEWDRIGV